VKGEKPVKRLVSASEAKQHEHRLPTVVDIVKSAGAETLTDARSVWESARV
jgi:hypothetical protein